MSPSKNRSHLGAVLSAVALAIAFPAVGQIPPPGRPLTIDDLAKVRHVEDPQISPEGRWVAYTVTRTDVDRDERDADIWMSSWDGTEHVRLTSSEGDETKPRWSPDGKYVAFLAARGNEDEKRKGKQVWLLDRRGGEPQKLTDMPGGVSDLQWSPDGTRLVLVASDPDPDDKPEEKEGWKRKTKPPVVITRYWFKEDETGYLKSLYAHLYVLALESRKVEAITGGPFNDEQPSWSPDGTRIAFVSKRGPGDPDRDYNSDIFVVTARAGATPARLTTWKGIDGGPPSWSPDGTRIAYLQGDESRLYAYSLDKLAVADVATGSSRVLTEALDRSVSSPHWSADGQSIVFLVEDDRATYVARIPATGGLVEPLTAGRRVVSAISARRAQGWAVIAGTAAQPDEVHVLSNGQLRRLSNQNDEWLRGVALATTDDVTFTAKDGTVVNGLLSKPSGSRSGQRHPGLLDIHGGPNGQNDHRFDFDRELLAANGYLVLQVNYRGSSGRGSAFQKAIYADWGHLEVVDLLAGADFLGSLDVVDPERLGIGGWSYGGILTNYVIACDGRFRAAVSGAGSSLQTSMYGVDQYIAQYELELGQPWQSTELWLKVSYPFFHADRIHSPTLFMGGDQDFNVPLIGSEQMYQALRSLGVETQLVIYPEQYHILSVPSYQRDRLARTVAWYDHYLKPAASLPAASK